MVETGRVEHASGEAARPGKPWVLLGLSLLLAVSVGFHLARFGEEARPPSPRVETVHELRDPLRYLVEFDVPMVALEQVDQALEPGLVGVEPHAKLSARFLTRRRLELRFPDGAPRFQDLVVHFAPAFHDAEGRSLRVAQPLRLSTGRLELAQEPKASFEGWDDERVVSLSFNGPVHARDLLQHLRLETKDGARIAHDVKGHERRYLVEVPDDAPAELVLVLEAGLASSAGPRGLAVTQRHTLTWPHALKVAEVEATRTAQRGIVTVELTHALAEQDLASYFEVDPRPADLQLHAEGGSVRLSGSFPSRARITVTVRPGLRSRSGATLDEAVERRVMLPRATPTLAFEDRGTVLSAAARPVLDITGVNVPVVQVSVERVYPNNVVPLALRWVYASSAAAAPVRKRIEIEAEEDTRWSRPLDLAELLGTRPLGIYRVEIEAGHPIWRSDDRLLQITDLAPTVRVTDAGVVVLTRRVSDASAVQGATVRLFDKTNQLCGEGLTDAEGLLVLPEVSGEPFVVTVEKGADQAYVQMHHHRATHVGADVAGRRPARGLEALLVADRGAVRPGEKAHLTGLLRDEAGRAAAEGLPVHLEVVAPDGRTWSRKVRRLGRHGVFTLDLPFAPDDPAGAWGVKATLPGSDEVVGRTTFRVAAIVPDRIEPFVELAGDDPVHGATVAVHIGARLPNGDPTPGLRAKLRVSFRPDRQAPVQGFAFGDPAEAPEPFTLDVGEGMLDEKGQVAFEVTLPEIGKSGVVLRASLEAEVIDVSGRAAFARSSRTLEARRPRLGVAPPGAGRPVFDLVLAGGDEAAGKAVLERVVWAGAWTRQNGRRVWRSHEVIAETRTATFRIENGKGRVAFPAVVDGSFRIRVQAEGMIPATLRYSRWGDEISSAMEGKGAPRLVMRPVLEEAAFGTETEVEIETPFAGAMLLTVEAPGLLVARVVEVGAGTHRVALPLPAFEGPGAHATATLVRGAARSGDGAARLMGACWIAASRPQRTLGLELDVAAEVLPERDLELRLRTSEPATVRVLAVDEGVLRLTGHPLPDPVAFFGARRKLETGIADAWARLVLRQRFGGEDAEVGGGMFAVRLDPTARKTIETVALASALVEVDGEASVRLPLPAWDGKLRVVAIGAGREGVHAVSKPVLVRAPVAITIHTPRAVAPGDVFDAYVSVAGEGVDWDLELDGLERLEVDGRVRLRALDAPGVATLRVEAEDVHGNVVTREARMHVRPPAPYTVHHEVLHVKAGETLEHELTGRWAGERQVRVTLGSVSTMVALPALEQLLEYPHGCVEQTVSRAFPILAWAKLWEQRLIEGGRPEDTVDMAIARLQQMQTPAGGLATWPGGGDASAFGSIYGADFLLRAKAFGRPVPDALLTGLLGYLEHSLSRDDPYLLEVLARAGVAVAADVDRMARLVEDPEDKARIAAALLHLGAPDRAEALLKDLGDPWSSPRDTGGRLRSPTRAAATVLAALAATRPDDPRVGELSLRLRHKAEAAGRHTTQENAAALLALAAVEQGRGHASATGWVEIASRRERYDTSHVLALDLAAGAAPRLRIEAEQDTTLVVRLGGHRLDGLEETAARGLRVSRTIEGLEDGPLKQGHVYEIVIEGELEDRAGNLLIQDLLPGGLEIEEARRGEGTLSPDRVEPRDDRVLFFRTATLEGRFKQTYLVRAVTPGTYRIPPIEAELLYATEIRGRSSGGATLEIVR